VRLRVQGREEDQRGPGERLSEGTVGLMNWARRVPWIVVGGGDDGGCPMVGMGVGECFFWYRPTRVVPSKRPLNGCVCVCVVAKAPHHSNL